MSNNKKAFTLIELMVAMGVIAVLIGLSVFGIQTVLRNQRNTERLKFTDDVELIITDFYNAKKKYPTALVRNGSNLDVRDGVQTYTQVPIPQVVSTSYKICYTVPSGGNPNVEVMIETPSGTPAYPGGTSCTGTEL